MKYMEHVHFTIICICVRVFVFVFSVISGILQSCIILYLCDFLIHVHRDTHILVLYSLPYALKRQGRTLYGFGG